MRGPCGTTTHFPKRQERTTLGWHSIQTDPPTNGINPRLFRSADQPAPKSPRISEKQTVCAQDRDVGIEISLVNSDSSPPVDDPFRMTPLPETRASLLLRLRDPRDQSAWETFLQIYQPLIFRLARQRGIQDADAREVTQDVLMAVAASVSRWEADPARGSFRGWIAKVTRNVAVNCLIKQARYPRGSGDSDLMRWLNEQPDPAGEESVLYDREEERRMFLWAADRVRPEFQEATWQAFWQTAVHGRDPTIVARELNVNVGKIYVSRSRVMKRLRECVQQWKNR